ncbi:GmrSD restriction endonuclease domain-containing protein [Saccharothrix isguenensis]
MVDAFAASLDGRMFQKGDPIKGTVDQPRLTLRERDHAFFEKHIQERAGIAGLASVATDTLPDSRRNLVTNATLFLDRLSDLAAEDCHRLVSFIDRHTYLVVVSTQDFESAYRIFTVLNERGLDLTHTDILKSEIIGEVSEPDQDAYTKKWGPRRRTSDAPTTRRQPEPTPSTTCCAG